MKHLADTVLVEAAEYGFQALNYTRYLESETCWATEKADLAVYKNRSKSVASSLSDIATEWHTARNGSTTPDQVHPGSSTSFWWERRTCGREWRAAPVIRAAGHRRSACGHRRGGAALARPRAGESLADLYPAVAGEWHLHLNGDLRPLYVKPFSSKKVWWRCTTCAHNWEAVVSTRSTNHGCPRCAAREGGVRSASPQQGQSLADRYPDLVAQWHPSMNGGVTAMDVKPFSMK
ncbi:zinc-ribbon domain-containing protein [Rhodococcus qingshengii]|uniref:zinc-ribbon domain-containing protein n=1 Tax=Rhodococcus qingshengii TaxID=334542 RepID=UPI0036F35B40